MADNQRTTEIHVVGVTVVALGLLVIVFGGMINHLLFACVVAGFGFTILADLLLIWKTLKDSIVNNKINECLGRIDKRLTGVEANLDKLLKK